MKAETVQKTKAAKKGKTYDLNELFLLPPLLEQKRQKKLKKKRTTKAKKKLTNKEKQKIIHQKVLMIQERCWRKQWMAGAAH